MYDSPPPLPWTAAPAPRSNGAATASLVLGLLGCIPFITSALAVILGIVGLRAVSREGAGGRGVAIAGLVLGIVGFAGWSLGAGGSIWFLLEGSSPAKSEAIGFLRDVSSGDLDAAAARCAPNIDRDALERIATATEPWGPFVDMSFSGFKWRMTGATLTWHLVGVAVFRDVSKRMEFVLVAEGKVLRIASVRWAA